MFGILAYFAPVDLNIGVLVGTRSPVMHYIKLGEDIPILNTKYIPTSNRKIISYFVRKFSFKPVHFKQI